MMKISVVFSCIILTSLTLGYSQTQYENQRKSTAHPNPWFDSLNVRFTGSWPFGGISRGVATDSTRNLMFLGSGGGVYLLDVTDPQDPIKISEQIHTRDYVQDLFYEESTQRLYIADGRCGLEIWDITDPVLPHKLGFCDAPDKAQGIYVLDSFAYIADDNLRLSIINVSTPANPQEVGYCDIAGRPCNVYVMGSTAYVTAGRQGLMIVDVSTPANPQVIGSCDTMETAHDVFVLGTYAYVTNPGDGSGVDTAYFHVIDISDPTNPFEVSRLILGEGTSSVCELYVCDTFAYLSGEPFREPFRIINIADPFNPYIVGGCSESGSSVQISGDYAYVASAPGLIIDISIPSDPQVVGRYEMPYKAYDVYVSAPYAYVADYRKGLYILDISSAVNPFEVGNCQIPGRGAWSIYTLGDYAYLPYKISGYDSMHLAVIDISDPSNPQQIGDCQADYPNMGGAWGIHVLGPYAYITIHNYWTGGRGGLWIVDVSDPSNPQGVGYFQIPRHTFGVYVVDTLAFLAATDFYVINVSDPSNPQLLGYCPTLCDAYDVHVTGSYAYVTDGWGSNMGLRVIDVSDPTDPHVVANCYVNHVQSIYVFDNHAFIATEEGLRIIDVSSPLSPQEVGYYTSTGADGVYALSPYVYMAEGGFGLQIYENLLPGIEEANVTPIESDHFGATIFSGPLLIPEGRNCKVFDITGRVMMPDKIKPGIYFIEIDGVISHKVIKVK